jgi:hypothetical protein
MLQLSRPDEGLLRFLFAAARGNVMRDAVEEPETLYPGPGSALHRRFKIHHMRSFSSSRESSESSSLAELQRLKPMNSVLWSVSVYFTSRLLSQRHGPTSRICVSFRSRPSMQVVVVPYQIRVGAYEVLGL